ncbi:MAG: L,D-transpeptidase family protein [Nitrospirales bacterium]
MQKIYMTIIQLGILFAGTAEAEAIPISDLLAPLVAKTSSPYQQDIEEVYLQRKYEPFWVSPHQLNNEGQVIFQLLTHVDEQALDPDDYDRSELQWLQRSLDVLAKDRENFRANLLARFEIVLSKNLMKFLDHASGGRLSPERVNGKWDLQEKRRPLPQMLTDAINDGISSSLESLTGDHEGLAPLLAKFNWYRRIESAGGWPIVSDGPLLSQGVKTARVKALRLRLAASGDLSNNSETPLHFDEEVKESVKRFQRRHGMAVDGLVGTQTLQTLNVSIESRIKQLLLNVERGRWMPPTFGETYVSVNIPDFKLVGYRDGEKKLTMPVIVGKPMNQTPIFNDHIQYIVFNPFWNVPRSIAEQEIYPKTQEDQEYLQKKNFEIVDVEDQPVGIDQLTIENIQSYRVRIRQKPGPTNALGLVKFMFPNDHGIYLHDTPADHLFDATQRDFSHGCIRVERPSDLADFLFNGHISKEELIHRIGGAERQEEKLPESVPVYILYQTAWVSQDGTLQFREDLYGHDQKLWDALHPILSDSVDTVQSNPPAQDQSRSES